MKEMICICCPLGCRMKVEKTDNGYIVEGNTCKRGYDYAIDELTAPKRMVTSSVRVSGGEINMLSVKTVSPVPKGKIFEVLKSVKQITVAAPVNCGDIIIKNISGTGSDIAATKSVRKKHEQG